MIEEQHKNSWGENEDCKSGFSETEGTRTRYIHNRLFPWDFNSFLPTQDNWQKLGPLVHGGEGNGTPLQYSCLENSMDGGAWKAAVHGVVEGWTQLSDFTFTFHFHALEKEMAPHSSVLAWRIPGTGEPGGLPSMGSESRTRLKWLSSSRCHRRGSIG